VSLSHQVSSDGRSSGKDASLFMYPVKLKEVSPAGRFFGKDVRLMQPYKFKEVSPDGRSSGKDVRLEQLFKFKEVIFSDRIRFNNSSVN
jgi:hypothetical protein